MIAKQIEKAFRWLPHVFAILIAIVVVMAFVLGNNGWHFRNQMTQGGVPSAHPRLGIIAWKQPIVPAQYMQASCGACHQNDIPQTPRLNHGRALLVRYNCIGCHQLQNVDRPVMLAPDLTNVGAKVSREWIYKWLKEPRTITDNDGNVIVNGVATSPRMPKFTLSDSELRALSAYLSVQRVSAVPTYRFNLQAVAMLKKTGDPADQGEVRFNQMFCITCHSLSVTRAGQTQLIGGDIGPELTKVGSKVNSAWLISWLRNPQNYLQHTKMPRYQWSDADLYAVTQYIQSRLTDPDLLSDVPKLGTPTEQEVQSGQQLFIQKGCSECHAVHGVTSRQHFGPDLSALGMAAGPYAFQEDAALFHPIPLHSIPGKETTLNISVSKTPKFMIDYIHAKITNSASVTPETHMPQFHLSPSDLDDLTTALLSMTGAPAANATQSLIVPRSRSDFHPDGQFASLYQRYKCEDCHRFNGHGGTLAPDLSFEGSRSQHEWLVSFLKNPQTIRPTLTVRMPEFNMSNEDAVTIANYLNAKLKSSRVDSTKVNAPAFTSQMAAQGERLYTEKYQCQSCHTIGSSGGYVGPSLNNAGNWLTPAWIEAWLKNPQNLVSGTIEPRNKFTDEEIQDLTAYLLTLKQSSESATITGGQ